MGIAQQRGVDHVLSAHTAFWRCKHWVWDQRRVSFEESEAHWPSYWQSKPSGSATQAVCTSLLCAWSSESRYCSALTGFGRPIWKARHQSHAKAWCMMSWDLSSLRSYCRSSPHKLRYIDLFLIKPDIKVKVSIVSAQLATQAEKWKSVFNDTLSIWMIHIQSQLQLQVHNFKGDIELSFEPL